MIDKETKVAIHLHAQPSVLGQLSELDPFFRILRTSFCSSVGQSNLSTLLHFKNQTEAAVLLHYCNNNPFLYEEETYMELVCICLRICKIDEKEFLYKNSRETNLIPNQVVKILLSCYFHPSNHGKSW